MRSNRYTVSIPKMRTISGVGDTTPPVESYDLGPKIRAAIAAGGFAFLGCTIVLWAVLALIWLAGARPPWQLFMLFAAIALIIGLIVTCWFGFGWAIRAATRAWDVDDTEIGRRHKFEDAQLEAQEKVLKSARERISEGDDTDGNPLTFTDEQRLDWIALRMLELVYMRGQAGAATRDAMTDAGFCSQPEWNLVNKGMKALKLRVKQSWADCAFDQAVASWRDNVRINVTPEGERYLQVLRQNGEWYSLERIE